MDTPAIDQSGFIDAGKSAGFVFHADCMEFMKRLRPKSIDFTLTDIPYAGVNRADNGLRTFDKKAADELTFPLDAFVREVFRISKKGCVIFCGFEQLSPIYSFFSAQDGFALPLGWRKNNPSPVNAENMYLSGLETAVFFQPYGAERPWPKSGQSALFRHNCGTSREHPTEKPQDLLKSILKGNIVGACGDYPGDLVFDPCAGSGSHLLAAMDFDCRVIGCELNKEFFKTASERINGKKKQKALFPHFNANSPSPKLEKKEYSVAKPRPSGPERDEKDLANACGLEKMKGMRDGSFSMVFSDISSWTPQGRIMGERIDPDAKLDLPAFLAEAQRVASKVVLILCNPHNFSEVYGWFNSRKGSVRAIAWENGSPDFPQPDKNIYRDNLLLGVWFKQESARNVLQNFFKSNCFCYSPSDPENSKRLPEYAGKEYKPKDEFLMELLLDNTEDILAKIGKQAESLDLCPSSGKVLRDSLKKARGIEGLKEDMASWGLAKDEMSKITALINGAQPDSVLDPFCGKGEMLRIAKKFGRRFYGCESDPALLAAAAENLRNAGERQMSDTRSKRTRKKAAPPQAASLDLFSFK